MDFDAWMYQLASLVANDAELAELVVLYSFEMAYSEGMSPKEALKDCRDWLIA